MNGEVARDGPKRRGARVQESLRLATLQPSSAMNGLKTEEVTQRLRSTHTKKRDSVC